MSEGRDRHPLPRRQRVGIAGAGYIADWHARALATVPGVELVAACDALPARARAFADRFGLARAYGSLESMLEGERLDAVHLLLPPDHHHRAARTVLSAGVSALLEKPMCERADECDALVRLAAERGLRLGVGHNFLFPRCYEALRRDLRAGLLGRIDHLSVTWHRELPQATHGPFDAWMLRAPGNVMLEIGSHSVAHLLDLLGVPDRIEAVAGNPIALPSGATFYRRWTVQAEKGAAAAELRFSFVPGFAEHAVHVRGALGSATVDLLRDSYVLRRHGPRGDDFDRHAMALDEARSLRRQAHRTLARYVLSKLHLAERGNPYGEGIARALDAFYDPTAAGLDERVSGPMGVEVIRLCERIAAAAPSGAARPPAAARAAASPRRSSAPRVLVLGATGFIGRELVRQLVAAGHGVRVLARSPSKLPPDLRDEVECQAGDLAVEGDLRRALEGIDCVYHLARADVRSWAEWQRHEVDVTRRVAEAALAAGVRRFVYTGTIDSYYAGSGAGTITEETPLDPGIDRRNLYARAKAASERILLALHRDRGLPLVIVRPGIVIGRGGSPFHWGVGMWWHGSVCQTWGAGRTPLPLVLVEDTARGLVAALDAPGIEGQSFNLVGDPCLSAQDYLDELERAGGLRLQRDSPSAARFYLIDLFKWAVKVLVRHPERRLPSYRDWESRTQRARFDCSRAKERLGWRPVTDRAELVRLGIAEPLREVLR